VNGIRKNRIKYFKNPLYWNGIKSNRMHRPKLMYNQLKENHSADIQKNISELIRTNWNYLNKHCVTFDQYFKNEFV